MSHPSLPALNQFIKNNNNNNQNNNYLTLSFDQQSCNSDPSAVYSTPAIQLDFEFVHLVKFSLLLILALFIPLLSLHSSFFSVLGYRTTSSHKGSHRRRTNRRKLPVNYEPPKSVVDATFIPLPTRRHFRISHVGNQNSRTPTTKVVYTNQSSSDSECDQSEYGNLETESNQRFKLVFGKRLRGEEDEFKGRSALKGSRLLASNDSNSNSSLTTNTDSIHFNSASTLHNAFQGTLIPNAVSTKAISFAPTHDSAFPKKDLNFIR